ncbi:MAG: DUF4105 domain-containing protein [Campylobacterales bacterium]|nr:DUF4105 domain-containing protein [Campylobacterales bacterium]
MVNGESEIDDVQFFFASDGKTNAKSELDATLDALFQEKSFDDNSSACKFPARKAWLKEKLNINDFAKVTCKKYDDTLKKLNPKSATLVYPSAHISSPTSMFGHTLIRINSGYNSRLLSYAVNYAAEVESKKTSMFMYATKGLTGGFSGSYSLLPYYEKLKEYRDTEQRDIWEYDLNLSEEEVLRMFMHIWELKNTKSDYYFFTENCSYNMLWFLEIARPSIHLREHFGYDIIPLETVHAAKEENIVESVNYRASKRSILLKYEELLSDENMHLPRNLVESKIELNTVVDNKNIDKQQKRYILEAALEFLEYSFAKHYISEEKYLSLFHNMTKARAALGSGEKLNVEVPQDPLDSHRALRVSAGAGYRDNKPIGFLGIRPAHHDLEDSNYGFLRGSQIEFLNLQLSYAENNVSVEEATILSAASLNQRSEFFDNFSWRAKTGWDRDYMGEKANFISTVGAGYSWGNKLAYIYLMADPLFYSTEKIVTAIGGSLGLVIDKFSYMNTNLELTRRWYDTREEQWLAEASQNFRVSQNLQLKFKYDYGEKQYLEIKEKRETLRAVLNYYF